MSEPEGMKSGPATVLIVDDTPATLRMLTEHVEAQGMKALVAIDGDEAIQRARLVRPDIVLMDVMMPGIDGLSAARLLKNAPETSDIPVILMTSLHDTEHKLMGFKAGAVDYVTKPLQLEEVTERLKIHLSLRELRRRLEERNAKLVDEIKERHRAEDALRESHDMLEDRVVARTSELAASEERYRTLYDDNPAMYFTLNGQGIILSVNRHGAAQLGYTPEELAGKEVGILFAPEDRELVKQHLALCLQKQGETLQWDMQKLRKDGSVLDVKEIARAVRKEGGDWIVLVVCEDVTAKHKLEIQLRQAQKMEAFGQLAGGIAHDFNNILTVIMGQAQCIDFPDTTFEEQTEALREISEAAHRASNLTRQLLVFSRRQHMQRTLLDPHKVVSELAKMLRRMIGEDISLELSLCEGPVHMLGDASMLEQVFMNMAVNARDAMPRGGELSIVSSRVCLSLSDLPQHVAGLSAGDFLRISVKDTGDGIPKEHLQNIFEPFYTTKKAGHGTGLGLATSQSIIQQHRGWIEVRSTPGEGTEFTIFLPLSSLTPKSQVAERKLPPLRMGAGTILLVEDEESVRRSTSRMLLRSGYAVYEASNPEEALHLWEKVGSEVDLLLTDIVMPGKMNGHELAEFLTARKPSLKAAFMSGYDPSLLDQRNPGRKHPRHYLPKPFSIGSLLKFIAEAMG